MLHLLLGRGDGDGDGGSQPRGAQFLNRAVKAMSSSDRAVTSDVNHRDELLVLNVRTVY